MEIQKNKLLGIFFYGDIYKDDQPHLRLENLHFSQLARLAPNYGLEVRLFSEKGLDLKEERVLAWRLSYKGKWEKLLSPIPSIIYIRGISLKEEENELREALANVLSRLGCNFINEPSFSKLLGNKWLFHQSLEPLLPEGTLPNTYPYNFTLLKSYLVQNSSIFLKPLEGHESRGLIYLHLQNQKKVLFYSVTENGIVQSSLLAQDELSDSLAKFMAGTPYILQKAIERPDFNGKLIEHRQIWQKIVKTWSLTTHLLRINRQGNLPFISIGRETNLLFKDFNEPYILTHEELEEKLHPITTALNTYFSKYQSGEYSLDFVINKEKEVKIIECNAKPSGFFLQTGDWQGRMLYLSSLLQHAQALSKADSHSR